MTFTGIASSRTEFSNRIIWRVILFSALNSKVNKMQGNLQSNSVNFYSPGPWGKCYNTFLSVINKLECLSLASISCLV
jgi:hypothetical protein